MTSKSSPINNIKRLLAKESLFHMSYKDGKPVKEKEPTELELIQKELNPDEDKNPADTIKSALYADQPKAKVKMDKSINARMLNQSLESYNKRRTEARQWNESNLKFSSVTGFEDRWKKYTIAGGWEFMHDREAGILKTTKTPDGALKMEYKSTKLKNPQGLNVDEPFILSKIEDHLKRNKDFKKN